MMEMLDFIMDLTRKRQSSFMNLIGHVFKSFVNPISIYASIKIHFPTTVRDADSKLLSGVHSSYRNFPVEDVYMINKHACISLSQKLDHAMAHGIEFHFLVDENRNHGIGGINNYPAARDLGESERIHARAWW